MFFTILKQCFFPLKVPRVYHRTRDKDKKSKSSSQDDTSLGQQICFTATGGT